VPYSIAAEQALIASVLLDEWIVWGEEVQQIVAPSDFFMPEHQAIWRAFHYLFERGEAISWLSTGEALKDMGLINQVDDAVGPPYTEAYLVVITNAHYAATGCSSYARTIKDCSERRGMIQQAQRLARAAYEPRENWKALPEYTDEV
jgi:replicative DNA helicase